MNNLNNYLFTKCSKRDKNITFANNFTENFHSKNGITMIFRYKRFFIFLNLIAVVLFSASLDLKAQKTNFTLVLDAGHGGHDPGAIGAISREKDINLGVVLRLGELVENNFKDVKVVYTRKTDKYLTLQQRADVVNNNHADLFISVHTNAAKSSAAYGSETFTLGLAKSKANLDVAMRENSVILLEDDYKTKYKGFDPNSVDSYIMFEFMQDKYIDKSIDLASNIQKQFVNYARRSDRGVRQAGFWVLHRSACPSVLIELGFISNPAEERFLASDKGQKELAASVYNAFVKFKHEHDKKSGLAGSAKQYKELSRNDADNEELKPQTTDTAVKKNTDQKNTEILKADEKKSEDKKPDDKKAKKNTDKKEPEKKQTASDNVVDSAFAKNKNEINDNKPTVLVSADSPVFKVQILASSKELSKNSSELKGVKNADFFIEGGLYKYTVGAESDYNKILNIQKELKAKFPDCFIIAFAGNKKMSAKDALKLIK